MESTPARTTSGSRVVLGMFALGLVFALGLWIYLTIAATPFLPLVADLSETFPQTQVRVEGGAYKSHLENSTKRLRVLMRSTLDLKDDAAVLERVNGIAERVRAVGFDRDYDVLEIFLYKQDPSSSENYRTVRRGMGEFPLLTLEEVKKEG